MGNGLMESFMEMVYLNGKKVHNIMENIFLAKNKVLVHLFLKIIIFIKEIGWMECNMGEEFYIMKDFSK